jgi:diguanylate cyclase (GGDEF)-like protein
MKPHHSLQQRIDRQLLKLTLAGSTLATVVLALVVCGLQMASALRLANDQAQAVERDLLEEITSGRPLSQVQRRLQIAASAQRLALAAVVNQQGVVMASSDNAIVGRRLSRGQLGPMNDGAWDAIWPCLPSPQSWWQHPRCQPPFSRTVGPWPLVGGERLVSVARTPLALAEPPGLQEGGLLITSLDLRPALRQAAMAGGLIVLAGLMLLVITSGGLVLVVRGQLMRQLVRLARTDTLTGLLNRDAWIETMDQWLPRQQQAQRPVVVAIAGVDRFKDLNAHHGYLTGDRVLAQLGGTLRGALRAGELVARLSGDQFGITLLGGGEQGDRLRELCGGVAQQPLRLDTNQETPITLSIGMACSSGPAAYRLDALLAQADRNLREAKRQGGNQVVNQ